MRLSGAYAMKTKNQSSQQSADSRQELAVTPLAGHWSPGAYSVGAPRSRRQYTVIYHGKDSRFNSCQCSDFRTGGNSFCRHIAAVAQWMNRSGQQPMPLPRRTVLDIDYTTGRRLRLRLADNAPKELAMAAMRFFDDDSYAVSGMIAGLPSFIALAKRIDRSFHCCGDALNYVLEERDRLRRLELAASLSDEEAAGILRTTLYPFQTEGIRLAFGAGRALIADEQGLGKTVQALGTAELMRSRNIAASVLVVCPTSLKYQWKKEIGQFTGADVTIVEGNAAERRSLYASDTTYRIVSYHTLANDIRALGTIAADVLILDEIQRLTEWNAQISQAVRRVDSDYAVVISGTTLENDPEGLAAALRFVDQYAPAHACVIRRHKADVASQLPARIDKTLYVPMTREQKEKHDEAMTAVAHLLRKWQSCRFLSEKDRKRLLLLSSRMRMACDSTWLLDLKSRYGTKAGETVQLLKTMAATGTGKAVVFSRWDRMTQLLARELAAEDMGFEYICGNLPQARRAEIARRFAEDPAKRVFLITDGCAAGLKPDNISLVINADLPWDPAAREQVTGSICGAAGNGGIFIINLVSAGTIEEKMLMAQRSEPGAFAGISDGGEDSITIDDAALARVAGALSLIIGEDAEAGTVTENDESDAEPGNTASSDEEDLARAGTIFLTALEQTLRSPEATERLLDSIVSTDPETGATQLRLPVPSRDAVAALLRALSNLLK